MELSRQFAAPIRVDQQGTTTPGFKIAGSICARLPPLIVLGLGQVV
jgi:hypothetical protein